MSYLTFDSWLESKRKAYSDKYLEEANKQGVGRERALQDTTDKVEHTLTMLQNKLKVVSDNLDDANAAVNRYSNEIIEISNKCASGKLSAQEVAKLKPQLEYNEYMHKGALQKQAEYTKELQNLSSSNDPNIFKSDLSELFNNLNDSFKEYLNIMSPEQMVILFNILGYIGLFLLLITITLISIGEDLIIYYDLQSKYPRLAKYINIFITLRKYQFRIYIIYFYFLILTLLSVNIFMFFYNYFYF
jgi:hypothetical protein